MIGMNELEAVEKRRMNTGTEQGGHSILVGLNGKMLQIWSLTPLGRTMARSTRNPRSTAWAIIHHLDSMGSRTTDQLINYLNITKSDITNTLLRLKSSGVVVEIGGTEVH